MALGDFRNSSSNNGAKSNKLFENTYYSRLSFKNNEGLRLNFSFKNGMIVVNIDKEKDGFQYETLTSCYLTVTKANVLLSQIMIYNEKKMDGTLKGNMAFGVNTGMGDVSTVLLIHMKDNLDAITIGKVNSSGAYVSKYTYVFNDLTNALMFKDYSDMATCEKTSTDGTEFKMFTNVIKLWADEGNGAAAYAVLDLGRYDYKAIMNKMNPIYDKLGIERGSYGNSNNKPSENNFFNGGGNYHGRSTSTSLDNIMDELPSEDD